MQKDSQEKEEFQELLCWNSQPTEARMTSTDVSSLLLTVTCMVTPSPSASLDLTRTSQPPLYTPAK